MQTQHFCRSLIHRMSLYLSASLALASATVAPAQFSFVTNNNAITITGYTGSSGDVVIPATTNGYPVTSIGINAFFRCFTMTNVTIPNGVTSIGDTAFQRCTNLISIAIPASVTSIPLGAFLYCTGLKSVTIPDGVTSIETYAFSDCTSLTNVTIPDSVVYIDSVAFLNCIRLANVTIPNSVTNIGIAAFELCTSLTNVTIPGGVIFVGNRAFLNCTNLTAAYFWGNSPSGDSAQSTIFSGESGTVYYLPGTTGWTNTFGGWPTVLWNPQQQTGDGYFGVRANQFGFNITGTTNIPIVVEVCTNLGGAWIPLQTCTVTNGSIYFSDPQWTNYSSRFYRLRSP